MAVTASLLIGCSGGAPADPDSETGDAGTLTTDLLESAGIDVVDSEAVVTAPPTALTLTTVQADRLVAEANAGAGLLGRDLDALAPVAADLPPVSYLVASYVSMPDLPGAAIAREQFPADTDWTQAGDVVFPTAVVALFVADMMRLAAEDASSEEPSATSGADAAAGSAAGPSAVWATAPGAPSARAAVWATTTSTGACTAVTTFLSTTIQGLFDVLRVVPGVLDAVSGLGIFGKILSTIINGAIDLAQGVVEGLISVVTQPVLEVMRIAIGALGVATLVVSFFSDQRLVVTPQPSNHLTFAVDPSTRRPGLPAPSWRRPPRSPGTGRQR